MEIAATTEDKTTEDKTTEDKRTKKAEMVVTNFWKIDLVATRRLVVQ